MSTELRCKDLVKSQFTRCFNDIKMLYTDWLNGINNNPEGNIDEYGLSFEYVEKGTFKDQKLGYFRYQISWGGPSSEFRIFTNSNLEITKIEYWYLDWYDGAKVTLTKGKEFEFLNEFFSNYFFTDMEIS